jgi:hypothetical protein
LVLDVRTLGSVQKSGIWYDTTMKVLITGVSGSGKTTIAAELTKREYNALNTDNIAGLCAWVSMETGEIAADAREPTPDWINRYDWHWNGEKLRELLGQPDDVFFCGSSGNQSEFYALFDKIFLLQMNDGLIRQRILNNDRDHNYGQMPGELEAILGYYKSFQDKATASGAVIIDADQTLKTIVDYILIACS